MCVQNTQTLPRGQTQRHLQFMQLEETGRRSLRQLNVAVERLAVPGTTIIMEHFVMATTGAQPTDQKFATSRANIFVRPPGGLGYIVDTTIVPATNTSTTALKRNTHKLGSPAGPICMGRVAYSRCESRIVLSNMACNTVAKYRTVVQPQRRHGNAVG